MSHSKQRIHCYIAEHPNCCVNEIAKALGVSRSCVSPHVSSLFKDGMLYRTGNHDEYRYSSAHEATENKTVHRMSPEMALFNKLLRAARE